MKKTFILIFALAMSMMAQAQILYRISGNGLQKDSYIMGTEHVIGGSFLFEVPGAFNALLSSELVCGELSLEEMAKQPSNMMLPEGKTIKDVLTEDEFKRLDECFTKLIGTGFTNEKVFSQMGTMSPAMLSTTISMFFVMQQKPKFMDLNNGIDMYVQMMGRQRGKGCIGLETMEFQSKVLFDMPLEKQVQDLMCTVDNLESYRTLNNNLTEAYLTQDIEKITAAVFAKLGNKCDATPEEEDRLVFNRNRDWAEKMPEIMSARSTFFAVGAGHLCGEKSVLALLKKKGYTVEAVK